MLETLFQRLRDLRDSDATSDELGVRAASLSQVQGLGQRALGRGRPCTMAWIEGEAKEHR